MQLRSSLLSPPLVPHPATWLHLTFAVDFSLLYPTCSQHRCLAALLSSQLANRLRFMDVGRKS